MKKNSMNESKLTANELREQAFEALSDIFEYINNEDPRMDGAFKELHDCITAYYYAIMDKEV